MENSISKLVETCSLPGHCIFMGTALSALSDMENYSIDSLVTDPPAGISFMNKEWDKPTDFIKDMTAIYKECLRVLKPGAHGLVWAIPRTSHWTATALEQAGFEIRDVITHHFGSGFPKSLDVSKAIDKMHGAEREVIGERVKRGDNKAYKQNVTQENQKFRTSEFQTPLTAPATLEAKQWEGWGTALKPASEHWILIRRPLGESTVAKNVLRHGTGGLNIDESRIGLKEGEGNSSGIATGSTIQGRFPSNLVFSHNEDCELVGTKEVKGITGSNTGMHGKVASGDFAGLNPHERIGNSKETVDHWQCTEGCPVKELDEQSLAGGMHGAGKANTLKGNKNQGNIFRNSNDVTRIGDTGGASRFFYCAKASKRDRGEGNPHPTVKSTKLMEYLIKLITPPNGTVLDPFMGSGSTGVAAKRLGFKFIGIEKELEYFEIAERRMENSIIKKN